MSFDLDAIAFDISSLKTAYQQNALTPEQLVDTVLERSQRYADHNIWIYQLSRQQLQPYLDSLKTVSVDDLPLYGIPFAIKDNIDLAGIPTTAGCEAFSYTPEKSAYIVERLIAAGAIPIGKTNLDQFATGLVGTRSPEPWGPCKNAFNNSYISGGSSSGSAVALALGLVSFSLGTDTAGSGRVPAMLNNLYGLKPSRGLFSMSGVVPACRSLDCPTVFALSAADAATLFNIVADYDDDDCYARENPYGNSKRYTGLPDKPPRIALPLQENLEFFGNAKAESLFSKAKQHWLDLGAELIEVDIEPLLAAAKLLYSGPWVAERYSAVSATIENQPEVMHPVVKSIIVSAEGRTAVEAFEYEYKMQGYRKVAQKLFSDVDFLLTPTAPTTYKIDELIENPVELNSNMGYYTNFMNLLDLCGIAVPVGEMADNQQFGVTLIAPAFHEQLLLGYAHQWQQQLQRPTGALEKFPASVDLPVVKSQSYIDVAVCGAHLSGMPLNWQLTERGAVLKAKTQSAAVYRMYALAGGPPFRPGLIRDDENGAAIDVEVWSMPAENFGSFVANIPKPLGIGKLSLASGEEVSGFICEPYGITGAEDITDLGSWREFIKRR